ncbi:hypothetical protein L1887_28986 [Cichorium endivia]|nr:hypothetical protein L1887_28986 [Cichorium endivia]
MILSGEQDGFTLRQPNQIHCSKERKSTCSKSARRIRELNDGLDDKYYPHFIWWKEKKKFGATADVHFWFRHWAMHCGDTFARCLVIMIGQFSSLSE